MAKKSNGNGGGHETSLPLAEETLRGDVRDWLLNTIKRLPKPWQKMSEQEQRTAIHEADSFAGAFVATCVELVAAADRPHLTCRVAKLSLDDKGAKLTIEGIPSHGAAAIDATRLQGRRIVLTLAAIEAYQGERAPARAEPDQRSLVEEEARA